MVVEMKKHLSVFLILSAAAASQAYTVQLVSQSVTNESMVWGLTSDLPTEGDKDIPPVATGIGTATHTISGSDVLIKFVLGSHIDGINTFGGPLSGSGYADSAGVATWTVKSKFKYVPANGQDQPSGSYNVVFDGKLKYYSEAEGHTEDVDPSMSLSASAYAALFSSAFPSTSASVSGTLLSFDDIYDLDQQSSWQARGSTHSAGVVFSYVNGEWVGEATCTYSQQGNSDSSFSTTGFGYFHCSSSLEIEYKFKPIQVGTYTLP